MHMTWEQNPSIGDSIAHLPIFRENFLVKTFSVFGNFFTFSDFGQVRRGSSREAAERSNSLAATILLCASRKERSLYFMINTFVLYTIVLYIYMYCI